jgi:hypothetical protein
VMVPLQEPAEPPSEVPEYRAPSSEVVVAGSAGAATGLTADIGELPFVAHAWLRTCEGRACLANTSGVTLSTIVRRIRVTCKGEPSPVA